MPFREIEPPARHEMIEPPANGLAMDLDAPSIRIFRDEVAHWQLNRAMANRNANPALHSYTVNFHHQLTNLRQSNHRLARVESCEVLTDRDRETARLLGENVITLGIIRLMREAVSESADLRRGFREDRLRGVLDFVSRTEPDTAFHVGGSLREELGVQPPKAEGTRWFEGEKLYIKALDPARPSQSYLDMKAPVFPAGNMTTLVPHLKKEYWSGDI